MIDTDEYEKMTWETPSDELEDAVENLLAEVKELRRQIKTAQGVLEYLYDDELEDAEWIRWFCGMGDEEE
jgi:metal-responsive CopG/Arc/MetJ family transcriptional regulator